MLECSVVVPVFNRAHLTRACLEKILAEPPAVTHEIIVVDNGSSDGTRELLASYGARVRVVTHERNLFYAGACNAGAAVATGRYLVLLNNDTVPLAGWLDALVRYADARPAVGLVAPKLLYPDGSVQHAGMAIGQDRYPRHIYSGFPADHPAVNRSRRLQVVSGAVNLIPRALFVDAGMFDRAFVNGWEDVDFCLRLAKLGREVHYCHDSELFHLESATPGRFDHDDANRTRFMERWADGLIPDDLQLFAADGLLRVDYGVVPWTFTVAPELGVATASPEEVQRVLTLRARQVGELIRENSRLRAAPPER